MAKRYFVEEYKAPKTGSIRVEREINLARWPQLFATRRTTGKSRRIKRGNEEIIIGVLTDNRNTECEVGILIIPDYVTLLGLIYIWELYNKPLEKITVHVRAFTERILRRTPSKLTYEYLEKSLWRLNQIPIRWINAFYDSKTGALETIGIEGFTFLQYLKIKKASYAGSKTKFKTFDFQFNNHVLENLLNHETRPLNLNEVVEFKRETSVLAYAFLDLIMAKKKHWERRARQFLQEDLQVTAERYKKPSRAREEAEGIAGELDGKQISSGVLRVKVRKIRNKNEWKLVVDRVAFGKTVKAKSAIPKSHTAHQPEPEAQDLIDQMARVLGKREENARFYQRIAQKCPRDLINTALQDTLSEERAGNITSSKSAFFGYWIQVLASKRGIDLGLKSSFTQILKED